jgi:hypothetical protein
MGVESETYRRGLTGLGCLCGNLLTRGLATSGLASGLLRASHCSEVVVVEWWWW